jgi:very-short-patch-repair endonuclease
MSELEETMAGSLRMNGLPEAVREYPFAQSLGRKWRFDFAWPESKVALEVEGGTFVRSKHTSGIGIQRDIDKTNMAVLLGWMVIRATKEMVEDNRAADTIRAALLFRGAI